MYIIHIHVIKLVSQSPLKLFCQKYMIPW